MRLLGGALAAAAATLVFSVTAAAQFPHVNSYEAGTIVPPWQGMYESAPGRMTVVPSPTDSAHKVMRVELRDGDAAVDPWDGQVRQRAEAWDRKGPEDRTKYGTWPDPEGSERWYGWRTYLDPAFPSLPTAQWTVITQWQDVEVPGSPPYALVLDGGKFELHSRGSEIQPWEAPATRGAWHEFLFHVKWSPNALIGFIELFHNGATAIPKTSMKTMDYDLVFPSPVYIRQGIYREKTITATQVLYHDTLRVGTTRAQVEP